MDGKDVITIGQLADRCGIATSAIRYYERLGLINSQRTEGGQRRFTRETVRRVAFIGAAQRVGRTLDEIREALSGLPSERTPTAADWSALASAWRARLDARIDDLVALRDQLDSCIGCGCLSLEACGIYNTDDRAQVLGAGPRYLYGETSADAMAKSLLIASQTE